MKSHLLIETVCVRARASASVRVHVREWTGVSRPTMRKLYTNS